MKLTAGEKRLLAFHYLFPVPKNRLNTILRDRPQSRKVSYIFSRTTCANLLKIKIEKAID